LVLTATNILTVLPNKKREDYVWTKAASKIFAGYVLQTMRRVPCVKKKSKTRKKLDAE